MPLEHILKVSKALGDETRLAIYRFLTTRQRPVTVAEVAKEFSIHPNAARTHLAKLEDAGLARSHHERENAPGRPARMYRAAASGMAPVFEPAVFKALATLLLERLASLDSVDDQDMEAFGRRWGADYASQWSKQGVVERFEPDYVLAGLARTLESWAFAATYIDSGDEPRVEVTRCPFEDLAERFPALVCPLVHGVLDGMLSTVAPGARLPWEKGEAEAPCIITMERGEG